MAGALFVVCLPTARSEIGEETDSKTFEKYNSQAEPKRTFNLLPCTQEEFVSITVTEPPPTPSTEAIDNSGRNSTKGTTNNTLNTSKKQATTKAPLGVPMETLLQQLLEKVDVKNAAWSTVKNGKFYQVSFSVEAGEKCEECIRYLNECGFGVQPETTVSVIPCTLFYRGREEVNRVKETKSLDDMEKGLKGSSGVQDPVFSKDPDDPKIWNWDKFMASVRSRLTVAEVVESVRANGELTFDFVMLLIVAGMVAAMGLVENSSVSVVASMLISPLMGPIMAGTFGIMVHDRQLQKIGVINELIGLVICIIVGYIYGLAIGCSSDTYRYADVSQWPTSEMISRGQISTLWAGVLVALPSGAGVALSVLGGNISSLVGVAISASLLPPAVNAGLFWALATVKALIKYEESDAKVEFIYFESEDAEYATLGAVSLCLTILNIVCIFIAGVFVLKVKEVAPQSSSEEMRQFWQHDIRVARDYNRTLQGEDASALGRELLKKLSVSRDFMEEARHELEGFNIPRHASENGAPVQHKESVISLSLSNNQSSWTSNNLHSRYMFHPKFYQKSSSGPTEDDLEKVVYSTLTADSKHGLLSSMGIIGVTGQSSNRKISSMSLPGNTQMRSPKISTSVEPQLDTIRENSTNLTVEPDEVRVTQSNKRFHITRCAEDKS